MNKYISIISKQKNRNSKNIISFEPGTETLNFKIHMYMV